MAREGKLRPRPSSPLPFSCVPTSVLPEAKLVWFTSGPTTRASPARPTRQLQSTKTQPRSKPSVAHVCAEA